MLLVSGSTGSVLDGFCDFFSDFYKGVPVVVDWILFFLASELIQLLHLCLTLFSILKLSFCQGLAERGLGD